MGIGVITTHPGIYARSNDVRSAARASRAASEPELALEIEVHRGLLSQALGR
jgi:hypothetical protein